MRTKETIRFSKLGKNTRRQKDKESNIIILFILTYFLATQPYTSPWWLAKLFYFIGLDSFLMRICWRAIQHDNNHAQTSQASQGAINKPMAYAQPEIQRALTDSNIAWQPCMLKHLNKPRRMLTTVDGNCSQSTARQYPCKDHPCKDRWQGSTRRQAIALMIF